MPSNGKTHPLHASHLDATTHAISHQVWRYGKCRHAEGCSRQPTYGQADGRGGRYCAAHRHANHTNLKARLCAFRDDILGGCPKRASYGPSGLRPVMCAQHRMPVSPFPVSASIFIFLFCMPGWKPFLMAAVVLGKRIAVSATPSRSGVGTESLPLTMHLAYGAPFVCGYHPHVLSSSYNLPRSLPSESARPAV